ncbi:hypothetical protein CASFOL_030087 [Castilleja foliolosa]|uniref:FLZ-type domain-containing protein n=1 Tax=Castilleja foliolosa TaxID=1961234 RepID=A0ABD3CAD5_9LAMI
MVGLSVILENYRDLSEKKSPQVIRKGSMIKTPSNPSSPKSPYYYFNNNNNNIGFLEYCFFCNQKLLPGKDIYMYKGDKAFCSEECRCRQIFMDEEEINATKGCTREYNCSLAATSSSHSPSTTSSSRSGKSSRNRANAFAY